MFARETKKKQGRLRLFEFSTWLGEVFWTRSPNTLSDLRQFNFYYMLTRWANQVAKGHQIRVTFDPGHKKWWQRGLYHHFTEDCGIDVDNTDFDALIDRVVAEGQQRCEQQSLCAGWCVREVGIDLDTYFHQATHFEQIAKCDEIDAAEVAGAVLAFTRSPLPQTVPSAPEAQPKPFF